MRPSFSPATERTDLFLLHMFDISFNPRIRDRLYSDEYAYLEDSDLHVPIVSSMTKGSALDLITEVGATGQLLDHLDIDSRICETLHSSKQTYNKVTP
jgi:hypothetical protein